jgi:hypothetical protein
MYLRKIGFGRMFNKAAEREENTFSFAKQRAGKKKGQLSVSKGKLITIRKRGGGGRG